MDPITAALVGALAVGAIKVGERVLPDAYDGLKAVLKRKFGHDVKLLRAVDQLEEEPEFEPNRATLEQRVAQAKAAEDEEVVGAARVLLAELERLRVQDPAVGAILKNIKAGNLTIDDVVSTGTGVVVDGAEVQGDMRVSKIRAGATGDTDPNA